MSVKRKDNKGRILRTGESQRDNGTYMYRYNTIKGKRKTIYAKTLKELREKEKDIDNDIYNEIDIVDTTLYQAVEDLINVKKQKLKPTTLKTYNSQLNQLKNFDIAHKPVSKITTKEAKKWIASLNDIWSYSHIKLMLVLIRLAMYMLIDDRAIKYNPFGFNLGSVLNRSEKEKVALTQQQEENLLSFIKNHPNKTINKNYLWMSLALETGMRISELWGLTVEDVDLENNIINVNKQRLKLKEQGMYIETPKTQSGVRQIPITDKLRPILVYMINHRGKNVTIGDKTYSFVCDTDYDTASSNKIYLARLNNIVEKYNSTHKEKLPHISPHTLRHTFCTKLLRAGVNIKAIQKIMGHKKVDISLNVYSHFDIEDIQNEMKKLQ